ncbi:PilL protein [gamma proteobacterium BDW918]|nr:PilL protein [gamma proteobacterium BDW918]
MLKKTAILCLMAASAASQAEQFVHEPPIDVIQTGRYSHVKNAPLEDELNPLRVVVKTTFPRTITTVGQAMNLMLLRSGYRMAETSVLSPEAVALMRLPLPEVHRDIGPLRLDTALRSLAGNAYDLVVDPVNRRIAFELSSNIVRVQ